MFKQTWLRIKYRKQLKAGYGLLHDLGAKRHFNIVNDRLFIVNGVDPMVRVDLTTGKAIAYTPPEDTPRSPNAKYYFDDQGNMHHV